MRLRLPTEQATPQTCSLQRKHPKLHEEVEASKSKDSKPSQSVKGVVPSVKGIAPSGQCSLKDIHQMLKKFYFHCSIKFSIVLCTSVCQYSSIPLISLA